MRSSSHSFSGLVSGTAVGWPFDGNAKSKNGLSATRQETFEVVTGRRVINRFRDKPGKKHGTRRRPGLSHRRIGSICTCQRCRAACEVQRFRRGLLGRRLALRVRTERDAARIIQNASRRWLDSRQAAAIQIQRTWRGYKTRSYLRRGNSKPAAIATSPVDGEVARVCDADETLKPEHEPELEPDPEPQADFALPPTRPLPDNVSRLHYSYIDETGRPPRAFNASGVGDQLFLNGVSMAVQCAAAPLMTELSAEALHWERERARQLKAHVAPVTLLQLVGGVRADSHRVQSEPGSVPAAVAGHQWIPTRTSLQRPTSDPQLLSKVLLQSRSSRSTSTSAGVSMLQARVHGSSRRPVSAPSSKSTSPCVWSSHSLIQVESRRTNQTR